jgi:hypothetical protein
MFNSKVTHIKENNTNIFSVGNLVVRTICPDNVVLVIEDISEETFDGINIGSFGSDLRIRSRYMKDSFKQFKGQVTLTI